jgi:hypothetical protein
VAVQDVQEGILQLENLISDDLHTHIDPTSRAAQVGWGVFFTMLHQVRAILTLHREQVCFASGPNRRTIVEYGLFLPWLVDDGEGAVDVLNRSLQNNQKTLATQIGEKLNTGTFETAAIQQFTETIQTPLVPHPDERLLKPLHLMDEYDSGLKAYYFVESRFSHVSLTGIGFFVKQLDSGVGLSQMPIPEEPIPCHEFCLHSLFHACLYFNDLLTGKPWTASLAQIASEYGLNTGRPTRKSKKPDNPQSNRTD